MKFSIPIAPWLRFLPALTVFAGVVALFPAPSCGTEASPALRYEVYATAGQVERYCSDEASRKRVAEILRDVGIGKIYLEAFRGDERPPIEILVAARDHFRAEGFEVATGITTIPGTNAGVRGNGSAYFLNYEAQATRDLLKELAGEMAEHFDEILVDDFFLTDDDSEQSIAARGERSWSEYRLALMTEIARDCLIAPARQRNPKVRVNIKFPQWYDVFHVYGYNVSSAPELFDEIWVGTETRNPETQRFGFAQPTMGFNNFRWLASLGGGKTVGAWFDALDCHENVYLMQAYQSVLAGAVHLTLFNLGEYVESNPVTEKFRRRRDSVTQLAAIVGGARPLGIATYKPPHSSPENDLYLFDFLAVLGLPILPVGKAEDLAAFDSIFLTGHSKSAPDLAKTLMALANTPGRTWAWTPSFDGNYTLPEEIRTSTLTLEGRPVKSDREMTFRKVHPPMETQVLAAVEADGEGVPVLMRGRTNPGLDGLFLNISTYSYEDFAKVDEMFLPPYELAIPHWPRELADRIRNELLPNSPIEASADPPFGLNLFEGGIAVVSNFGNETKTVDLKPREEGGRLVLHPEFGHAEGVALEASDDSGYLLELPAWEIAVVRLEVR